MFLQVRVLGLRGPKHCFPFHQSWRLKVSWTAFPEACQLDRVHASYLREDLITRHLKLAGKVPQKVKGALPFYCTMPQILK